MSKALEQFDATVAAVGSKATFAGAATSLWGWITSSQFGVVAGVFIGIAGLALNWYFKRRTDQREQREHEARMRKLVTQPGDVDEAGR